ncbi:hypothetical protein SAMN05444679_1287 [Variovorax sp. CF079]|uniref:nuclear transport factor 2 family protein n=1 Tax=Variovorax sp. CF079 TaxID=1882774 RepID=UPI00087E1D44|nr:nuclear transport factor 2 family protein [Variovorax sp. CF079]SDE68617.1 hypothetical protein SAMN05444679_1287 [Variovorax sp. CF079]
MRSPRDELLHLVRSCYAAFAARDLDALCALVTHDCAFEAPGLIEFMPWAGAHRGRDGIRAFVAGLDAHLVFHEFEPARFLVDEEAAAVVVTGRAVCASCATQRRYVNHWAHLFETSDCKIARFREYPDTAAQLAAVHPWWDTRPSPVTSR